MLYVIVSQCFMIFVRAEILSEKSVLKFPERNVPRSKNTAYQIYFKKGIFGYFER